MTGAVVAAAVVFAAAGVGLMAAGIVALKRRRLFGVAASLTLALLLLTLGALCGAIAIGTQGYRALTREEVAAVVRTEPLGPQEFAAHFRFPDGRESSYSVAGDQLYVDAHILKWKPLANLLGLHTAYELDRVGGRYVELEHERTRVRSVFSLAQEKPIDMFTLRRRYALFRPLLDAEYGSATFVGADEAAEYEVRVSTSGLLIRRVGGPARVRD